MTADGGTGSDSITGGPRADTINNFSGKNKIWGLGGADQIESGDGNDKLYGGAGETITVNEQLLPIGTISGVVTGTDGTPVAGVLVDARTGHR